MADILDPQPQPPLALAPAVPPPLVLVPLVVDAPPSRGGGPRGSTAKKARSPCALTVVRRGVNTAANATFAAAVGSPHATMVWQRHLLETQYNLELVGWPTDVEFVSPGYLGSLPKLKRIRSAFKHGAIRFVALTLAEVKRRRPQRAAAAHARRVTLQTSAYLKPITRWRIGLSLKKAQAIEEVDEIEEAI